MRQVLSIVVMISAFTIVGCASTAPAAQGDAGTHGSTAEHARRRGDVRSPVAPVGGQRTFLDTLNVGREVALSASDLPQIEIAPAAPPPAAPAAAAATTASAVASPPSATATTATPAPTPAAAATPTTAPSGRTAAQPAPVAEPRFRIQIMASSSADVARREMATAEAAINLPVTIASEQSLFKLYAGEFATREAAEAALATVRERGYRDAWIVSR